MLRMTVNTEEYIQIGDDIRIVFLGGSRNHTRVMLDVPKEINVVRSRALENHAKTAEEREKISHYHAVPEFGGKVSQKEDYCKWRCQIRVKVNGNNPGLT